MIEEQKQRMVEFKATDCNQSQEKIPSTQELKIQSSEAKRHLLEASKLKQSQSQRVVESNLRLRPETAFDLE